MENYKIIKSYLETLPKEMTVSEAINNIAKAEKQFEEGIKLKEEEMKKYVGNTYYYEDIDDSAIFTKFVTRLTGTKRVYNNNIVFTGEMIEISDGTIYYLDDTTFSLGDFKDSEKVDSSVFDDAKKKYDEIQKFSYSK